MSDEGLKVDELRVIAKVLKPKIEMVYLGKAANAEESVVLKEVIVFLQRMPKGIHLFCDPDFESIASFALVIFSFRVTETIKYVTDILDPTLFKCKDCILKFVRGKSKILQHFAIQRLVAYQHVTEFGDMVDMWRIKTILPILQSISTMDGESIVLSKEIKTAFYECLCNPRMLRLDQNLKGTFDAIFTYLTSIKYPLLEIKVDEGNNNVIDLEFDGLNEFIAGVVYCWYQGTPEQFIWAKKYLMIMHNNGFKFNKDSVTPDIIEEINYHLLILQDPKNWNSIMVSTMWLKLTAIFSFFDKTVFSEYFEIPKNIESLKQTFNFPIESIFKLWYNHVASIYQNKPMDILLRALNLFLEIFKSDFWLKLEPYTFHSVLDTIFSRDTYILSLKKVENNSDEENDAVFIEQGTLSDMVTWTIPFYHSVSESKKIQMIKKVALVFLRHIANRTSNNGLTNACFLNSSTALLKYVLVVKDEERAMLYKKDDFETILYTKIDFRIFINNPLIQDVFIRTVSNPSELYPNLEGYLSALSLSAMSVIGKCVSLDILLLCHYSYKLYLGKTIADSSPPSTLLEIFTAKLDLRSFQDGPLLAKQVLVSLRGINGLLVVPMKTPIAQTHNAKINKFLHLSSKLLEKCTDILPSQMSDVLGDDEAAQGFWSCIFSSNSELYQAATNILYDTFDVEGRLEGIQAILKTNLTNHIKAINIVLKNLITCEFYEPCPRAVRVLMDVVSACIDPSSGIFSNFESLKEADTIQEFRSFWDLTWKFLDTIYKCTLTWASKYDYSELENFTKDTLELSRTLIDSYREFSDIVDQGSEDMFGSVLNAIKNMLYWLRLSDEALLESCVHLIVSTSDLANEKNIMFNDTLVAMMARYALKAKKYSNKLTEHQSNEILTKTKLFNNSLTEKVRESVELYKKEKEMSKRGSLPQSQHPTQHSTPTSEKISESRADFLQRKAMASSITGRPKALQSKITSFGSFKSGGSLTLQSTKAPPPLSKMELARRQLLNNRVVHPPSSTVFHSKQPTRTVKKDDSSSDESDDGIESARELFAIAKSKGKGIQTLDINGKPVKRATKADIAKLEEEYMRKRLNIDLNPFYEMILQWDYNRKSEYPSDENIEQYVKVKDSFKSYIDYQNVMRPLLLLECWQGLCSARDRVEYKPFSIIVGNRTAVSDFYEIYASVRKSKVLECGISDSDLIVLAYIPDTRPDQINSGDDFRRSEHTCLAKVKSLKNTKGDNVDITLRVHRNHKFSKFLSLRSEIHAIKVMQMTTVEREFTSLEGLEYYDLAAQLLEAKPTSSIEISKDEIEKVKNNYQLNKSQAEAIVHTVANEGFSLIQGPPGTGKTKTILGIIGYFLSTRYHIPSNVIRAPTEAFSSNLTTEQMLRKQKVLICAPSNAAVDEIVLRLKGGIFDKDGKASMPKLVRIGRSDAVNALIKDLTLEELVDKRLAEKNYDMSTNPDLEKKFSSSVKKRRELRSKLDAENGSIDSSLSTEDISKLQLEIRELSKQLNELGRERDEIRERNSITYRNRDLDRRNAQASILASSNVICSTLSGSAHDVLSSLGVKFDTVIIDEACQCTELSAIIPLRYGAKRCIMVGDPNQLPPTVLSGAATKFNYNQSLFVRMEKNSTPYLLNVQYRMHPSISVFPSVEFYKGRLKDGPNMATITKKPWHESNALAPYKFYDIVSGRHEQNNKTMSYINVEEAKVAVELVDYLLRKYENKYDFSNKIGIISPYKEQVFRMRKEFKNYFGSPITKYVDFNTIDGFQGQEKEIIIISCVRANDSGSSSGVGFLKDFRRMNVALTRAKSSMWILGHHKSLYQNKLWGHLISDAKERNALDIACSGFLDDRNNRATKTLEKYKGSHDYITGVDDYYPDTGYSTSKIHSSKRKLEGNSSSRYNKSMKLDKNFKSEKYSDLKKESIPTNSLGSKKKSSVFGNPINSENSNTANYFTTENKQAFSTKKKSSIFGGPTLASKISMTTPYIKGVSNSKDNNKSNKHVRISDDISIIPCHDRANDTDYSIKSENNGKIEDNNKVYSEEGIEPMPRLKYFPLKRGDDKRIDDEDDYEIALPIEMAPSTSRSTGFEKFKTIDDDNYTPAFKDNEFQSSNIPSNQRIQTGYPYQNQGQQCASSNGSTFERNPGALNNIQQPGPYNYPPQTYYQQQYGDRLQYPIDNQNNQNQYCNEYPLPPSNILQQPQPQGGYSHRQQILEKNPGQQNQYNNLAPSGYLEPRPKNRRNGSSTPFIPKKKKP